MAKKTTTPIIVFILGALLTICIFVFQDDIKVALGLEDPNAPYRQTYSCYEPAKAVVVSISTEVGHRNRTQTTLLMQFRDPQGELITGKIAQYGISCPTVGDSLTIYFDPTDARNFVSESTYNSVMGK